MKTQHTPGPWQLNIDTVHIREGVNVQPVTHSMDSQGIADAHLIASASELLSTLNRLVDCMTENKDGEKLYADWLTIARAAIAKAEGRAE